MTTAQTTRTFEVDVPPLRTFLHVDADSLHPNVRDQLERQEGRADYVDADMPRDWEITEEIMQNQVGAALVDSEGTVRYEEDGPDAAAHVRHAVESAKVEVTFSFDTPKAKPAGRTPRPDVLVNLDEDEAEDAPVSI